MFFLAGAAASSAMDLISSLRQTVSGTTSGVTTGATQGVSFDPGMGQATATSKTQPGASSSSALTSGTMRALLAAQGQQSDGNSLSSQLFSLLDSDGDGTVSKTEFEQAFAKNSDTAKADSVFAGIDTNGDGSISLGELGSALKNGHHRNHQVGEANGMGAPSGLGDGSSTSNSGTTSKTVTNADGSVTTTITYSDGSKVSLTQPAPNTGQADNNLLERMILRQAQMFSPSSTGQSLAVTA